MEIILFKVLELPPFKPSTQPASLVSVRAVECWKTVLAFTACFVCVPSDDLTGSMETDRLEFLRHKVRRYPNERKPFAHDLAVFPL